MSEIYKDNLILKAEEKNLIKIDKDKKDFLKNINQTKINLKGRNKICGGANMIKYNKMNQNTIINAFIFYKNNKASSENISNNNFIKKYYFLKSTNNLFNWKIINLIFILNLIFYNCSDGREIYSKFSNITIRINGSGIKSIFYGDNFCWNNIKIFEKPDEVYINNVKQIEVKDKYDFEKEENFVKLVWKNIISECNCLFRDCVDITFVDLSKFDFSNGLSANGMFWNCNSITSINLNYDGIIKIINSGSCLEVVGL